MSKSKLRPYRIIQDKFDLHIEQRIVRHKAIEGSEKLLARLQRYHTKDDVKCVQLSLTRKLQVSSRTVP